MFVVDGVLVPRNIAIFYFLFERKLFCKIVGCFEFSGLIFVKVRPLDNCSNQIMLVRNNFVYALLPNQKTVFFIRIQSKKF